MKSVIFAILILFPLPFAFAMDCVSDIYRLEGCEDQNDLEVFSFAQEAEESCCKKPLELAKRNREKILLADCFPSISVLSSAVGFANSGDPFDGDFLSGFVDDDGPLGKVKKDEKKKKDVYKKFRKKAPEGREDFDDLVENVMGRYMHEAGIHKAEKHFREDLGESDKRQRWRSKEERGGRLSRGANIFRKSFILEKKTFFAERGLESAPKSGVELPGGAVKKLTGSEGEGGDAAAARVKVRSMKGLRALRSGNYEDVNINRVDYSGVDIVVDESFNQAEESDLPYFVGVSLTGDDSYRREGITEDDIAELVRILRGENSERIVIEAIDLDMTYSCLCKNADDASPDSSYSIIPVKEEEVLLALRENTTLRSLSITSPLAFSEDVVEVLSRSTVLEELNLTLKDRELDYAIRFRTWSMPDIAKVAYENGVRYCEVANKVVEGLSGILLRNNNLKMVGLFFSDCSRHEYNSLKLIASALRDNYNSVLRKLALSCGDCGFSAWREYFLAMLETNLSLEQLKYGGIFEHEVMIGRDSFLFANKFLRRSKIFSGLDRHTHIMLKGLIVKILQELGRPLESIEDEYLTKRILEEGQDDVLELIDVEHKIVGLPGILTTDAEGEGEMERTSIAAEDLDIDLELLERARDAFGRILAKPDIYKEQCLRSIADKMFHIFQLAVLSLKKRGASDKLVAKVSVESIPYLVCSHGLGIAKTILASEGYVWVEKLNIGANEYNRDLLVRILYENLPESGGFGAVSSEDFFGSIEDKKGALTFLMKAIREYGGWLTEREGGVLLLTRVVIDILGRSGEEAQSPLDILAEYKRLVSIRRVGERCYIYFNSSILTGLTRVLRMVLDEALIDEELRKLTFSQGGVGRESGVEIGLTEMPMELVEAAKALRMLIVELIKEFPAAPVFEGIRVLREYRDDNVKLASDEVTLSAPPPLSPDLASKVNVVEDIFSHLCKKTLTQEVSKKMFYFWRVVASDFHERGMEEEELVAKKKMLVCLIHSFGSRIESEWLFWQQKQMPADELDDVVRKEREDLLALIFELTPKLSAADVENPTAYWVSFRGEKICLKSLAMLIREYGSWFIESPSHYYTNRRYILARVLISYFGRELVHHIRLGEPLEEKVVNIIFNALLKEKHRLSALLQRAGHLHDATPEGHDAEKGRFEEMRIRLEQIKAAIEFFMRKKELLQYSPFQHRSFGLMDVRRYLEKQSDLRKEGGVYWWRQYMSLFDDVLKEEMVVELRKLGVMKDQALAASDQESASASLTPLEEMIDQGLSEMEDAQNKATRSLRRLLDVGVYSLFPDCLEGDIDFEI